MKSKSLWIGLGALTATAMVWSGASASDPSKEAPSDAADSSANEIASMSWLEGRWTGDVGGDRVEEVWSAPEGDCMMGMFRWMRNGKVWMYELLTIVSEGDGVVLRFKHFNRHLVGWEEKAEALTFRTLERKRNRVVFDRIDSDELFQLVYERDGDRLSVVLRSEKDGKTHEEKLSFTRTP